MRRADRLFRLVEVLRRRRFATAAELAEELEVARRTIYRDVADLAASGVPIRGEAGVGFQLEPGFDLPPVMLTPEEAESLAFAGRMLAVWADDSLARPALTALSKLSAVLPAKAARAAEREILVAPRGVRREKPAVPLLTLKRAIEDRRVVDLTYVDLKGRESERLARPLALSFFGPVWLLLGWCEAQSDFRNFRLDRIAHLAVTQQTFREEPGRRLVDFLRRERDTARQPVGRD